MKSFSFGGRLVARFSHDATVVTRFFFGMAALALLFPICLTSGAQKRIDDGASTDGCGTAESSFTEHKCQRLIFGGAVSADQMFSQKIGGNLVFRLNPHTAMSGWTIEVVPERQADPAKSSEYIWVVNEPYRSYNVRDLDTSYGTTAKDAVSYSPREFNFVLNEAQFQRAADLTDILIMSRPYKDRQSKEELEKEWNDAYAKKAALQVGKGRLTIRDARITESKEKGGTGSIDWLKFDVELHVPCKFATGRSDEISIDSAECSAAKEGHRQ